MRSSSCCFICGAVAAVLCLCPSQPASAAESHVSARPTVRGIVQDTAGHALAHVQIVVAPLNRMTTTDTAGRFAFAALAPGAYRITALSIGYAPARADVVVPSADAEIAITLVLRPTALVLAGMQVSATPVAMDPREVPQAMVTLSGKALGRQLGSTLAQTVGEQPGIAMRFNGPAATAPIIRGLQGERVLVLQDGNRAADLSSSAPDHGTSIDPLTAQRIEVVRGPASLLYGNQALGGVVNVITNDIPASVPSQVQGSAAMSAESVNPGASAAAGLTVPLGEDIALVAKGGARHSDDLRVGGGSALPNTFYRNAYGLGAVGFTAGGVTGGVAARDYQFRYGLPSAGDERSMIDGHRHEVLGRSDMTFDNAFVSSLHASGTAQWYQHAEINEANGRTNTSFDLKTQTLDVIARTRTGRANGAVGFSSLFKEYGARGDEALTPAANSRGLGGLLFQEVPLSSALSESGRLVPKLQLGARYDVYRIDIQPSDDPKFDRFVGTRMYREASGSLGLSIPLSAAVTMAASAARAFRAPSVEELSSNAFHAGVGSYDVGNPSLKAEINQGFEGVLRVQTRRVNGEGAVFWNGIQNYITPNIVKDTAIVTDDGLTTLPLNRISQADARLRGIEGELEVEVIPHVVVGAMGDMVRGELTATRQPLPFIPAARVGTHVRWDDGRFTAQAQFRHGFAQDRVPPATSPDDPSGIATSSYSLVNASVGWNVIAGARVHAITLRVDNLLDQKYVDATSRLKSFAFNPGRNVALLYRVTF